MRFLIFGLLFISFQLEAKVPKFAQTESVLFLVQYEFGKTYQDVTWANLPFPQEDIEKKKWIYDFETQFENSLLTSGYYLKHIRKQHLDIFLEGRFKKSQLQAAEARELMQIFNSDFVILGSLKLKQDQVHVDLDIFEKKNFVRIQKIQLVEKYKQSLGEILAKSIEWNREKPGKET